MDSAQAQVLVKVHQPACTGCRGFLSTAARLGQPQRCGPGEAPNLIARRPHSWGLRAGGHAFVRALPGRPGPGQDRQPGTQPQTCRLCQGAPPPAGPVNGAAGARLPATARRSMKAEWGGWAQALCGPGWLAHPARRRSWTDGMHCGLEPACICSWQTVSSAVWQLRLAASLAQAMSHSAPFWRVIYHARSCRSLTWRPNALQAGESVAMKIESTRPEEAQRLYGRHFDHKVRLLCSHAALSPRLCLPPCSVCSRARESCRLLSARLCSAGRPGQQDLAQVHRRAQDPLPGGHDQARLAARPQAEEGVQDRLSGLLSLQR